MQVAEALEHHNSYYERLSLFLEGENHENLTARGTERGVRT